MKPERRYRNNITRHLRGKVYYWPVNDSYTAGVPDHWYSGNADCLWIEYKYYPKDRKRFDLVGTKQPKLSVLQQNWINKRYDEGRNVWVVVGMPGGGIILRNKEWMHPVYVEENTLLSNRQVAEEILLLTTLGDNHEQPSGRASD